MSPPEVEKIGLAKAPKEQAAEPPAPQSVSQADETPASAAPVRPRTRQPRRIHPILVLGLLVAVAGLLLALSNAAERAAQLESQVAFLSAELDQAQADLAGYEQQMNGVRSAVADLNHRMSSLTELVNQPPSAGAAR